MSWRLLVETLHRAVELHHETGVPSDLTQLAGLASQMDGDTFLPLRSEEITTAEVPRRLVQFAEIIAEPSSAAVNEGLRNKRTQVFSAPAPEMATMADIS